MNHGTTPNAPYIGKISFLLWLIVAASCTSADAGRPNIVLLLADNLGYNDVGAFGAPSSQTPNIDRLAHTGMKLNNWNSAAHLCSASRAAILTGKYPARMGIYPRVFRPDAVYGLQPNETTLAEYLSEDYATSIVGKWHLGHRPDYLPTNQGFDEWTGIPYHMSGGSLDGHECYSDENSTMWLPLYHNEAITQQPVQMDNLAHRYAAKATQFIEKHLEDPFFLFMSFSHVHQLCAPKSGVSQPQCQWSESKNATFVNAVEEMDWIAGQILDSLDDTNQADDTLVIFTSDNGPWVAEQECAGSKGPFEGRWLSDTVAKNCTACPSDYVPTGKGRTCILRGTSIEAEGVHCGVDTGLGSVWEANLRMPAIVRWPGHIAAGSESMGMVSSLDIVPTVLSIAGYSIPTFLDGVDISNLLFGGEVSSQDRTLFFWRDGFQDGPLPAPFGRFDVAAVKIGDFKAWLWTKSAHYNDDIEVYHDPPLLFDVIQDPAEAYPLDPTERTELIATVKKVVAEHKASIPPTFPLALAKDPKYLPCYDKSTNCRTPTTDSVVETALS